MPSFGFRAQAQVEGVTVIGEAVRRIPSESAEFVIEVTSAATTAAQALRENQAKTMQVTQAIGQLGAQPADIQTISLKVQSLYAPVLQSLPAYAGFSSMGQGGFSAHAAGAAMQPNCNWVLTSPGSCASLYETARTRHRRWRCERPTWSAGSGFERPTRQAHREPRWRRPRRMLE